MNTILFHGSFGVTTNNIFLQFLLDDDHKADGQQCYNNNSKLLTKSIMPKKTIQYTYYNWLAYRFWVMLKWPRLKSPNMMYEPITVNTWWVMSTGLDVLDHQTCNKSLIIVFAKLSICIGKHVYTDIWSSSI